MDIIDKDTDYGKIKRYLRYLMGKIPELNDLVDILGFLSIEELLLEALGSKRISNADDAEREVLMFILRCIGKTPPPSIIEMKKEIHKFLKNTVELHTRLSEERIENI